MHNNGDKQRQYPSKPEWKIILEQLVYQDPQKTYRLCRKMIIFLNRIRISEIATLLEKLNPSSFEDDVSSDFDKNWPKPKGSPFIPSEIIDEVFSIADKYLSDEIISQLIQQWIFQENISFISTVLERRYSPHIEVIEAIKRYFKITGSRSLLSPNESMGMIVSLIQRFLSDNLNYVNIAKNYISLELIDELIDKVIGPAYGNGKLGGKSAGLILAYQILLDKKKKNPLLENVQTPRSWFLTSDGLLEFVHYNALEELVFTKYQSPEEIVQEYSFLEYIFKNSHFPPESITAFNMILDDLEGKPIVIRSSSLLEDSFEASFSGKYKSLFIANVGTKEERLSSLTNAIAEVYASTFSPDPIEYRKERGLIDFREDMGVLIQEVVGTRIGKYYLPSFAGVAFSNNEFRWSPRIKREDGIVRLVAGLGTRAVDRTMNDYPTLVCPGIPSLKINYSIEDRILYSQHNIDVINLETNRFETIEFAKIIKECKGNYPGLHRIVSFNRSGMLVEPVSMMSDFMKEELVVTFNSLIDKTGFIKQLKAILDELQSAFNSPVDIEFASDGTNLFLLQCRPQSRFEKDNVIHIPGNIPDGFRLFTANQFVSNGLVDNIEYVVYVVPEEYQKLETNEELHEVGRIVGRLNRMLPKRKFILMGPGRWGSKGDVKLGVPVIYSDINNTAMLIEIAKIKEGYVPELSFGTHFFQDLVEANIKYLPLYPDKEENYFKERYFLHSNNSLTKFIENADGYEKVIKVINVREISNLTLSVFMDGDECQAAAFLVHPRK